MLAVVYCALKELTSSNPSIIFLDDLEDIRVLALDMYVCKNE